MIIDLKTFIAFALMIGVHNVPGDATCRIATSRHGESFRNVLLDSFFQPACRLANVRLFADAASIAINNIGCGHSR